MSPSPPILGAAARSACATAAIVATGFVAATVLGAFHGSSPRQWLRPSPELMAMTSACQDLPGRAERQQCTQRIVAARLARERQPVKLAQSSASAGAAP